MAWLSACRTPSQNLPLGGKDKLAGAAFTKGNNISVVSRARTPTVAPSVVAALFSIARYLEDDLQRIFRTVLDSKLLALSSAFTPQQYKGLCEKPLKTQFLDIYWDKTYLEYYNFFQQCEDHFTSTGAKGQNWMPFTANGYRLVLMASTQAKGGGWDQRPYHLGRI